MIINDDFLNDLRVKAAESHRLRMNYDLRNSENENSQRMLNAFELGTVLPIHRHKLSSETVVLLRGRVDEVFFDDSGKEIDRYHLDPKIGNYGVQIPLGMWHTIEVLEPSVIFEAKHGAYQPVDIEDILQK